MKKPAAISGAIIGVLAGFGSIIPCLGIFCCLFGSLGGGVLAVKLYQNETGGRTVLPADGAKLGAIAGGIGAAIYLLIAIPLSFLMTAFNFAIANQASEAIPAGALGLFAGVFGSILGALFLVGLSTAGGALGATLFKGPSGPAAPPPQYPGTPGFGAPPPPPYGQGGQGNQGGPGY